MGTDLTRVYIAGRFSRRVELHEARDALTQYGFICTSRWLDVEIEADARTPEHFAKWSVIDLHDVRTADAVVLFNDDGSGGGGGRHSEFGMGLALGKLCIVCGVRTQVFHHHPDVYHAEDLDNVIRILRERRWCPE